LVDRVTQLVMAESYSGPVPHPRHLKEYEDVFPGCGERLIGMAETALDRDQDRRDRHMELDFQDRRLGMKLGYAALATLIIAGVVLTLAGYEKIGGSLLAASLISTVVGAFINGRKTVASSPEPAPPRKSPSTR
jgi:uncharacterized membrane protein